MAKQDCGPEILELKKQMEELMAQQAANKEKAESAPEEKEKTTTVAEDEGEFSEIKDKIEEFADLLQQELKQIPTMTAVAIFALGVLMGRIISK
jgi:hypothetical protein